MKILKFGTVTLTEGDVLVEDWNFERDEHDPPDASPEELITGFAIVWAQERFKEALRSANMDVFRRMIKQRQDEIRADQPDFVPDGLDRELKRIPRAH